MGNISPLVHLYVFSAIAVVDCTGIEPSYSNESCVSVSRIPLDEFQNAFWTKYILIAGDGFTTSISINPIIHITLNIRSDGKVSAQNKSRLRCLFFAVNFHAFNFELEKVWGIFKIALEMSYSEMPSNFL